MVISAKVVIIKMCAQCANDSGQSSVSHFWPEIHS